MFKVGQKVVCKNTKSAEQGTPYGIEKGVIYTVIGISTCVCGKELLGLKEVEILNKWCGTKNVCLGMSSNYYSFRFEPLVEDGFAESLLARLTKEFVKEQEKVLI